MSPTELETARLAIEEARLEVERQRLAVEQQRIRVEAYTPGLEGIIKFAEICIRSLLILNGGSALALLSFPAARQAVTPQLPSRLRCSHLAPGRR